MLVFANNLLQDSMYGMVYRVSIGAIISMTDAGTDIYVITTYFQAGLNDKAFILLAMILSNTFLQLSFVLVQYKRKGIRRIMKELLIGLFFLRPAVDAYRVSTNHDDSSCTVDSLFEMMLNKGIEMFAENIPGCVLQCYVWMQSSEKAGQFALLSVFISSMTTGYTSAMMSFDLDVDQVNRKNSPKFFGYIPGTNPTEM